MGTQPVKILLVDDEADIAAAVAAALGRGYQVVAAADSGEAFEILTADKHGFSIVVADHMMPGWAGAELIKRLQLAGFKGKFIVLSGYLSPEVEAVYHALGVEYVLAKPFDVTLLRNAVAASVRTLADQRN